MLKKFGEASDVAEMRDMGFQMVLGDYPIDDVQRAFIQYLKTGKEIPTPADIVEILDPTVKPLCPRVYQSFVTRSKKGPFELTREEKAYIEHYENQQLGRIRA
ncbi:hypothetical protein [Dyadobacter psychrotolerans]|uniref:Uncharacterized protein n=1 Tax=Dyadobacter psychrotolerans TaxID=2541721 RepID=A0A4R5DT45_9BACT|nr:hypothetical protein [Dyadobacter psychrotolerans]TDE17686.1 hypothetical protein E0F88_07290 [Dyadobacter psychrotolerans]